MRVSRAYRIRKTNENAEDGTPILYWRGAVGPADRWNAAPEWAAHYGDLAAASTVLVDIGRSQDDDGDFTEWDIELEEVAL